MSWAERDADRIESNADELVQLRSELAKTKRERDALVAALRELKPAAATEDWHAEYGRVLVKAFRERDAAKSELLLRDVERTVADKRVLDAAEAWRCQWGPDAKSLSEVYHEPATRELFAAAVARALGHAPAGRDGA